MAERSEFYECFLGLELFLMMFFLIFNSVFCVLFGGGPTVLMLAIYCFFDDVFSNEAT